MFQALEGLVSSCDKVIFTLKADKQTGIMSVVVAPVVEKATDPALTHPFHLSGTAADLDAHFGELVAGYTQQRLSLADQAAATALILDEAKKSQTTKAANAIAKGGKAAPASSAAKTAGGNDDGSDDDTEEKDDDSTSSTAVSSAPAAAQASTPVGTDMADLLG